MAESVEADGEGEGEKEKKGVQEQGFCRQWKP
jgi:hypothetical protein